MVFHFIIIMWLTSFLISSNCYILVQCNSQIAIQKVVQMCVTDCLNVKEYVKRQEVHKFVLTLRSMAVLYNLSCWGMFFINLL